MERDFKKQLWFCFSKFSVGDSELISDEIDGVDQRLNEINHKIIEKVDQKKQKEKGIQKMRNEVCYISII